MDDNGRIPAFLLSAVQSNDTSPNTSVSSNIVPNNSLDFPNGHHSFSALASAADPLHTEQSFVIAQLQEKLELYERLSKEYEDDLSARDDLVDELSIRVERADEEVEAWRTEAEHTARKFNKMRDRVTVLAQTCEKLTNQRAQAGVFDQASRAALQQLHQRCGSLDASKVAYEQRCRELEMERDEMAERAVEAERERDEARRKGERSEREGREWRDKALAFEQETEAMIETLNSLGDTSFSSRNSRVSMLPSGRPLSAINVMSIDDIVSAAQQQQKTQQEEDDLKTPSTSQFPVPSFLTTSPSEAEAEEAVYVLKSEILKREQLYSELRSKYTTLEFQSTEERTLLEGKLMEERTLLEGKVLQLEERVQELEERVQACNEEITVLEEEKLEMVHEKNECVESLHEEIRMQEMQKEALAGELQEALANVEDLERARDEVSSFLDDVTFVLEGGADSFDRL